MPERSGATRRRPAASTRRERPGPLRAASGTARRSVDIIVVPPTEAPHKEDVMDPDMMALFHELADRSPAEREDYYQQKQVPVALRADVESLLRFDLTSGDSLNQ